AITGQAQAFGAAQQQELGLVQQQPLTTLHAGVAELGQLVLQRGHAFLAAAQALGQRRALDVGGFQSGVQLFGLLVDRSQRRAAGLLDARRQRLAGGLDASNALRQRIDAGQRIIAGADRSAVLGLQTLELMPAVPAAGAQQQEDDQPDQQV